MKQTRSVACELDIRAALARDAARQMPLGDARTETLREVMILENAAEMHRHFLPSSARRRPSDGSALIRPS
ncbi:MAG: hypothetical protein ABW213_11730 [Tardiphaga sp.]